MRPIQLLPSIIALFVRIQLSCSSIRRLPPNRADGVAVFVVPLFGTTALPSSTAIPLTLLGGSLRIELHSSSMHMNRASHQFCSYEQSYHAEE